MLKEPGPKKRFTLMLILIHVIALPLISAITYYVLKDNAIVDAYNLGRLRLTTMGAVRHYVAEELRPIFYREMPGRFIVEGMSRSFVAASIADRVQKDMPGYQYKNASLNPKNPRNAADAFEAEVIKRFVKDPKLKEWEGFRTKEDEEYYVLARAGEPLGADCLKCHGDPANAPKELKDRYGAKAGFNMKEGDMADAAFVYIPISVPFADAQKVVAVFIGMYIIVGSIIFAIVQTRFNYLYNQIASDKKSIEDINLELMNLNHDMEYIIAERTLNLIALSVADRIRNPATAIAGTFNRILKKEELSDTLRERLIELMVEADKLDMLVREYETILKNKQMMFRVEDLNEVIQSILPLIEGERKKRGIELSLALSAEPQRCMANKQLLRIAIMHILNNAVEATPESGKITIGTYSDHEHVTLSITDTGKGITQEDQQKMFTLFYSTKKHRMGMGLPLVKQIIEEHKGEITVESEPDKGTTFRLVFPVRWSEQELLKQAAG